MRSLVNFSAKLFRSILNFNFSHDFQIQNSSPWSSSRFPLTHEFPDGTQRDRTPSRERSRAFDRRQENEIIILASRQKVAMSDFSRETAFDFPMLPRSHRLTKKLTIGRIFRTGRSIVGPELILKFSPNRDQVTRVAVLVGTKISKKAVARNRIKRCLRAAAVKNLSALPRGLDLLIIARTLKLSALSHAELRQKMLNLILRLPKNLCNAS